MYTSPNHSNHALHSRMPAATSSYGGNSAASSSTTTAAAPSRRYNETLMKISADLRPYQVRADSGSEQKRRQMQQQLVDRGYDDQKSRMALELVEYESVSAAIDVLLVSRQPANMITSGGTNIITIPNMYSPQQPTAPAQAVANYGRISIPVLGSNESGSSRSNSPAGTASPDLHYSNSIHRYTPVYAGQRRPCPPDSSGAYALALNLPGKSSGVSQLGMTHSITIPGDDEYCLTGPPSAGGDLAQTSPTSSASTSSQQINGLIQRVQRVLQNSEILNPSHSGHSNMLPPTVSMVASAMSSPGGIGSPLSSCHGSEPSVTPRAESPPSVRRSISPMPTRLLNTPDAEFESPILLCAPRAFCFFMEQHIENVIKLDRERRDRRKRLEKDMLTANFDENVQRQMRNILAHKESKYLRGSRQRLDESMFEKIKTIGVGAFGKVVLVRKQDSEQKLYAMKTLRKRDVIELDQAAHVKAERDILAEANSEWIVKLYCSFQDTTSLFFIMEYIAGGDLMSLLIRQEIFTEDWARFYTAELVCAIESVHKLGFIHRDIKPDNILIDKTGHIKLTDFGLCTGLRWTHDKKYYHNGSHTRDDSFDLLKHQTRRAIAVGGGVNDSGIGGTGPKLLEHRKQIRKHAAHSLVGTSNYMAPEVLTASGHDQRCDWWSVGVILYEMVVGCPPFYADDPAETQNKVINYVHYLRIPVDRRLSAGVCALILQLCCDKDVRLGACGDAAEVKTHEWFAGVNFENIRNTNAPHRPTILHATDTQNFDAVQTPSDEAAAAMAAAAAAADTHKQHDRPTERKGRKGNNGKHKRGANPAFFEFTFRHFFDMEPLGLNGCQMPETTRPQQQRPSLAPLIEQQQQMMLLQQQQQAAATASAAQSQAATAKRTPPPPYPMGETNNNHILSAPIQMYHESHQQPAMLMMTNNNYNQRTPHEYYTQHDYV